MLHGGCENKLSPLSGNVFIFWAPSSTLASGGVSVPYRGGPLLLCKSHLPGLAFRLCEMTATEHGHNVAVCRHRAQIAGCCPGNAQMEVFNTSEKPLPLCDTSGGPSVPGGDWGGGASDG